jgi:hypothetical protein
LEQGWNRQGKDELAACRAENAELLDVIDSRERAAGFELVPAPDGSRVLVVEEPPTP